MIKKIELLKNVLIYTDFKRFSSNKLTRRLIRWFTKYLFSNKCFIFYKHLFSRSDGVIEKKELKSKIFFDKKAPLYFLKGMDVIFISKTGKNLFISWLNPSNRLILSKSLMTLNDPKKQITKKQKSFSAYFLLKRFSRTLRRRYRLTRIALLLRGSLGIRRKKALASGIVHSGLKVKYVLDITNVPFNGCQLKKKKRS